MGLFKVLIKFSRTLVAGGTSFDTSLPLLKRYLKLETKDFVVEVVRTVPLRLPL